MIESPVRRPTRGSSHRRAFIVATALLLTLATPAAAQDGPTWGARPAPGEGERTSGAFNLSVAAGSELSDGVEIFNFTDDTTSFDVYVADATATRDGGLTAAARDAEITGPATWIKVDSPTVQVPPRSSTIVPFTMTVPHGTVPGDHTAALLVESQPSSASGPIATRTRVALWVKVKVTGVEGEVQGDTSGLPGLPWIVVIPLVLAFLAWLLYVTRDRRRQWVRERQEERALLRDFRNRRRSRHDAGERP